MLKRMHEEEAARQAAGRQESERQLKKQEAAK